MDINLTLLGQTIAMIVFVWFCMKFIWPPIMQAIEERQTQIADGLAAAEKGKQNLDKANAQSEEILTDARKQANTILEQANQRANKIVSEGKSDGVKEREKMLKSAKSEIKQQSNRARAELSGQVVSIALAGAEKLLQREFNEKDHDAILSKLAKKL